MKLILSLVPLAALASAFVIPDEQIAKQLFLQSQKEQHPSVDRLQDGVADLWDSTDIRFKHTVAFSHSATLKDLDAASDDTDDDQAIFESPVTMEKWDVQGWLEPANNVDWYEEGDLDNPHKKPPHDKPTKTVYELIAGSSHATTFLKIINEYPDLVETLNNTAANYTVFVPTNEAFEKLPHHEKPSKELIKKVLAYHISPHLYTTKRLLFSHTLPTALHENALGGAVQRLRVSLGPRGLYINVFSKIIAHNFVGTNGVVHAVDSIIFPPPPAIEIIKLLPAEFSTFELGLAKTGLTEVFHSHHTGGTLFAPSNFAFRALGPKINAFLFSTHGQKYLNALLRYHIVANQTLYSDAYYQDKAGADEADKVADNVDLEAAPRGAYHVDLPTLLKGKSLSIDSVRFAGLIQIKINAFTKVSVKDGIAKDGVIHVVNSLLIPPKSPYGVTYSGEEMSVEEFKSRFDFYVEEL